MKIMHGSIPSDDPRRAAEILAAIMGGEALPFPPGGSDSWMAWSGDGATELEIVRRGDVLIDEEDQGNWHRADTVQRQSECHLALAVDRSTDEIIAIAREAGWPARLRARGGGFFELVELDVSCWNCSIRRRPPITNGW